MDDINSLLEMIQMHTIIVSIINPFRPNCKTVFFSFLQIFMFIFPFSRPKHDQSNNLKYEIYID